MKKPYFYLGTIITSFFLSCSGGGDGDPGPGPDPVNTAPTVPSLVYPLSNTLCIDNNVVFQWNPSTDSEGNPISYSVEVSESSNFASLAHNVSSSAVSSIITLEKGKSYYWRIKAKDNKGAESAYSTVSQFLTEGDGVSNHLPFAPELVAPALNSEIDGTSTTLSWTANDVDGDTLSYDVYFGTEASPSTKVSDGQSGTTYEATGLTAASTYYFKIVAKDGNGGATIGQIWSFTTK